MKMNKEKKTEDGKESEGEKERKRELEETEKERKKRWKKMERVKTKLTRPDTRPIPVADGWAGAEMRVFPLFDSSVTDQPTNQPTDRRIDRAGCRVACTRLISKVLPTD